MFCQKKETRSSQHKFRITIPLLILSSCWHFAAILQLNSTLQLNPFIVPISMLTHPPLTSLILNATLSM